MTLSLFLLGLGVGSFLNVVIERLPQGQSVVGGRSRCPKCGHVLAWYDLIPLLSFVLLRGRCRYCQERISFQYPLVEFITGVLFASVLLLTSGQFSLSTIYYLLSTIFLIPIFVIDLKHGIIPDRLVIPGILLVGGFRVFGVFWRIWRLYRNLRADVGGLGPYLLQTDFFRDHAWLELRPFLLTLIGSLFLLFAFYFLLFATKGRGIGGGDVKLAALVGLIAGFPGMIVAVFSAFLTGAIVSVILILLKKKKFGETVPFGPFLIAGTYSALFWGDEIVRWYLGLL